VSYIPAKIELVVMTLNSCCKVDMSMASFSFADALELSIVRAMDENAPN
jgi:hypothetical protein